MFYRTILTKLEAWAEKKDRKPLILRGARQVGKTTLVELFSMEYDTYLYLNLELQADKDVFGWVPSLKFLFLNMHTKSF